ncbi:Spy/CpxP family protein refolding chaperone [Rhodomicrobium sp. Az07]|uniref:Spy/CpxP family protein refolding chaperone n=1 Tax=Rhodomicrobium sp. Az07 TaxID=2839034 RepID=UPI001BEAEC82|nr:Spy/CpxP family protein refolding chaperone [Rhodomicrobium sp. Az07]MBT3070232.1 Spy/CpxP family protein refolding chaperone [Rhodomicrobium sp. Az07]
MNKSIVAGVMALALVGPSTVYAQRADMDDNGAQATQAQPQQPRQTEKKKFRFGRDDMKAFADARIAGLKAGLKLTSDQEKNWPPVEQAMRDIMQKRMDQRLAKRDRPKPENAIQAMKERAEQLEERGGSLKKLADAAEPLYQTLSDAQKRRLVAMLKAGDEGLGRVAKGRRGGRG